MKINANAVDEQNARDLLKKQTEALKDGVISNDEKLGLKQAEIEASERRIAELRKQYNNTNSEEARKKITLEIAKEEAAMAEAKAEKDRMALEMKKQEKEEQRKIIYERLKEALLKDGKLDEDDKIKLKKLELAQEKEREKEYSLELKNAKTPEEKRKTEKAVLDSRIQQREVEKEIKDIETQAAEKRLRKAKDEKEREFKEMQADHRSDGYLSHDEEERELYNRLFMNRLEREGLKRELAKATDAELKESLRNRLAEANLALGNLYVEQKRQEGAGKGTAGSVYGSLLSAITGNPLEEKKVGLLEKIEDSNRKILQKGAKLTFGK